MCIILFIGTILAIWLMSVKLKMHDAAIGFIGSSFDLIAAVCYSFVTQPWQLYAGWSFTKLVNFLMINRKSRFVYTI